MGAHVLACVHAYRCMCTCVYVRMHLVDCIELREPLLVVRDEHFGEHSTRYSLGLVLGLEQEHLAPIVHGLVFAHNVFWHRILGRRVCGSTG